MNYQVCYKHPRLGGIVQFKTFLDKVTVLAFLSFCKRNNYTVKKVYIDWIEINPNSLYEEGANNEQ